ncbi:MAG TPA: peptidylprolyl isomerase [Chryseolinea sp.]
MRVVHLLFVATVFYSCKSEKDSQNKFSDHDLIRIADLQDRRSGDSLIAYFTHDNPVHRREAALAFASVQDSVYVDHLGKLLSSDADTTVRMAAAYAIGQTSCVRSEELLFEVVSKETNISVQAIEIESYGKVCRTWKLDVAPVDSVLSAATAWAYYRMAVRGIADQPLNTKASVLLTSPFKATRLAAAHYFSRGAKDFDQFKDLLINVAGQDKSADVRMAAALALRKIISGSTLAAAGNIVKHDADYRVRVNAIRALQDHPFEQTKDILLAALIDSNVNVGIAASEVIKSSLTAAYWREVVEVARSTENWRIKNNLFEAALSVSHERELAEEIQSNYQSAKNPYEKAAALTALRHVADSYPFIAEELFKNSEPVLKTSAALALVEMNSTPNFDKKLRPKFADIYRKAIATGDAAVIGIIASTLADSALGYKSVITDFNFLKEARKNLSLPKDFESIAPLETAIAYFEGEKSRPLQNSFNHPISWDLVKKIPRDQKAIIKTSKGEIVIRLFVEESPGSVANFVALASAKYYDGRVFHRVVPNFVAQAGCPRGDGWGSEAYSIRSEFTSGRYSTGSIGMASAGKDTEGTQWFITHSATPHLEGRYTRFAEVEQGLDVAHKIEVGDVILSVEIMGFNPL